MSARVIRKSSEITPAIEDVVCESRIGNNAHTDHPIDATYCPLVCHTFETESLLRAPSPTSELIRGILPSSIRSAQKSCAIVVTSSFTVD